MMRMFVARQAYIRLFHYSLFSLAFIFSTTKAEKEEDECNREERKRKQYSLVEILGKHNNRLIIEDISSCKKDDDYN
jgi:hypothetical protein